VHKIRSYQRKRQLQIVIGTNDDSLINLVSELLKKAMQDKYDLKINSFFYGEELLEFAENKSVDVFILIVNNIRFRHFYPPQERIEKSLHLITQIRAKYKKPIIALAGSSVIGRNEITDATFFFHLPFKEKDFIKAIDRCFEMLHEFDMSKNR
jgi:hypothetical protein